MNGSYHLPLRICECVRPLAEEIVASHRKSREDSSADEGLSLPAPKKAAVLGVRPVVVEADSPPQMAQVVREVFECYAKGLELDRIAIVERDPELQVAIRAQVGAHLHVESQSINKIKGLERSCIVWSTRIRFLENEAVKEWAYTIMTCSSGLLVLVIGRKTRNEFKSLINRLRKDRLLYWSRKAKELVKSYSS